MKIKYACFIIFWALSIVAVIVGQKMTPPQPQLEAYRQVCNYAELVGQESIGIAVVDVLNHGCSEVRVDHIDSGMYLVSGTKIVINNF